MIYSRSGNQHYFILYILTYGKERRKIWIRKKSRRLEKRVEDLERLVDEIVQWKEDRVIIQIDKNWKPIGEATHRYRCSRWEAKEED